MAKKIILTKEAREELNNEYRHLIDVERPEIIEKLQLARSQGDLSENADYDAARDRQAQIESRISEIESIFQNSVGADENEDDSSKISIGCVVNFKEVATGIEGKVKIIGNIGADPMAEIPSVSNESPLGKALLGHSEGEEVNVASEEPYVIKILNFKR